MKLIKRDNYFILDLEKSSGLNLLIEFLKQNNHICPNIIIDLMNCNMEASNIINTLFPFHLNWEKRNKSFILVSNMEKKIIKHMISLNSREEAIDFFHMEELTRNI